MTNRPNNSIITHKGSHSPSATSLLFLLNKLMILLTVCWGIRLLLQLCKCLWGDMKRFWSMVNAKCTLQLHRSSAAYNQFKTPQCMTKVFELLWFGLLIQETTKLNKSKLCLYIANGECLFQYLIDKPNTNYKQGFRWSACRLMLFELAENTYRLQSRKYETIIKLQYNTPFTDNILTMLWPQLNRGKELMWKKYM